MAASSHAALLEVQRVEKELHSLIEGWPGKLSRISNIIDKRVVWFEEELDRVMALVGEKIQSGMEDLNMRFAEALEVEGVKYGVLSQDMELVKSKLETAQCQNHSTDAGCARAKGLVLRGRTIDVFTP
jgi:hypothetical protein